MTVLIAVLTLCALAVVPGLSVAAQDKPIFTGPSITGSAQPMNPSAALFDSPRRSDSPIHDQQRGQGGMQAPVDPFDNTDMDLNADLAEVSVRPFNFKLGGVLRGVRYSRMQQTVFADSIRPYIETKRELWGQWETAGLRVRSAFLKSRMNDRIINSMTFANNYEFKVTATRGTRITLTEPVTGLVEQKRFTALEPAFTYLQSNWSVTASSKYTAAPDTAAAESFNTWWAQTLSATYHPTESLTLESSLSWRMGDKLGAGQTVSPAALSFLMAYQSVEHPEVSFAMMGSWGYSPEGLVDKTTPYAKGVFNWQPEFLASLTPFHPILSLEAGYTKLPVSFRSGQTDEDMRVIGLVRVAGIPWQEISSIVNRYCDNCSPFEARQFVNSSARRF